MNTLFPRLLAKHSLFGAGADARARGGVSSRATANVGSARVAANIGSNGAAVTANLAVTTARAAVTAKLAVTEMHSNGKATKMETAMQTAAVNSAALETVKVYTDLQTAAFAAADRACEMAANGAPIAFIAALLVADYHAAGHILVPRGKDPARVSRMALAKAAFGSERSAFRYFGLAGDYKAKCPEDAQKAVEASTKDAEGKEISSAFGQIERACDMLVKMMALRGYRSMHDLDKAMRPAKAKEPKDKAEGKASEGTSAAEGQAPSKPDAMTSAQRLAVIVPMIEVGGFTVEEHKVIVAALAKVKPAKVQNPAKVNKAA